MMISALLDALALLLPTDCAACGAPDRALCASCSASMQPRVERLVVSRAGSAPLDVWSALPYRETVRSALSSFKEHGRTDAAAALARPLAAAVADARRAVLARLPPGAMPFLVVAPSSRAAFRLRGYDPVALLASRARGSLGCRRVLRVRRRTLDQAGLGVSARQRNLAGSLALRTRFSEGSMVGANVILVDDVATTGATLLECRRALESGGARVWAAATLAFTERRSGPSSLTVKERSAPDLSVCHV